MKFVMSLFIIKHIAAFFIAHPVLAALCAIVYVAGSVVTFKLGNNSKRANAELFAWTFILLYLLPIALALFIVCADLLFIPLYINDENAYANVYGYFIGLGVLVLVVPFVLGIVWQMMNTDLPELGAP